MNITCYEDVAKLNLVKVLEIMKEKSPAEIAEFQKFAQEPVVLEDGTERAKSFFELRNWVVKKYFPEATVKVKEDKPTMLDKVMAL